MDMYSYLYRFWIIVILFGLVYVVNSQNPFSAEPQNATVDQGVTHLLDCTVNQTYLKGYFFVAWRREGVVIAERTRIEKNGLSQFVGDDPEQLNRYAIVKYEQNNEALFKLQIGNTKGVDSGNYQCVICEHPATSYGCTSITDFQSRVATYTVKYTPSVPEYPQCTGLDSPATVSVGTVVEVTCTSDIGDPKVDLQWDKDGANVNTATEREDLVNNRIYLVYTFTAALSDSEVVLRCSSSSTYFPSYSESCDFGAINVVDMPVVILSSGAAEYEEGSPADFTCKVSSATSVSFDWTVGDIPSSRYTKVDSAMESVVTITSVESTDHRSIIKCAGTNTQGQTVQKQVTMEVVGGHTGIIPTSRNNPPTTKAMTTKKIVITSSPSAPGVEGGSIGAIVGGAVAGFITVLLIVLLFLYCYKKNPHGKVMSIGAPYNVLSSVRDTETILH